MINNDQIVKNIVNGFEETTAWWFEGTERDYADTAAKFTVSLNELSADFSSDLTEVEKQLEELETATLRLETLKKAMVAEMEFWTANQ